VALDSGGNAYVTGSTSSSDFPAVNPHQPGPFRADDLDAFLVKVPAAGGPFTFATRLGGGNDDRGLAVAVDGAGNAYVTGDTLSPGFPTVRPIQAASGGSAGGVAGSFPDAFVSKFNSAGSALVYSTFLGGGDFDQGTAIAVDAEGAAYVAGNTNSPNFPTVNPLQAAKGNDADAFVAKIDPPGAALVYSTYLGGNGADGANGIAVDRSGNAHVVGTTGSANYPTVRPTQGNRGGADDAFVLKLNNTGRAALFSTFLGGREADAGMGVGVDGPGTIRVLGLTGSADFPSVKPFQGARPPAGGDAFVADLDPGEAAGPAASPTTSGAGAAAASSSASASTGHDRRVRLLGALTLVLLLAAVLQTMFLRRRPPVPAGRRPGPAPKPSAAPGLRVLDDTSPGAAKKAAVAKATAASKASRAPKARGGPKGGPQRAGGAQKAGNRKTPARPRAGAVAGAGADAAGGADDGGRPTEASPAVPKTKPQAPAIAQLLEEDLWAPEPPAAPAPDEVEVVAAAPTEPDVPAPSPEVQGQAGPEPRPEPEPEPAAFIPPVPAEELSFWDLFPEDLPPARAASFPAEDLLADLALPEGPDSAAGRLLPAPAPEPSQVEEAATEEARPPRPPEAEIVIAELLDGPVPTGLRATPESPWAPPGGDDLVISELLVNQPSGAPPGDSPDSPDGDDPDDDETAASAMAGRSKEEQARIAADQARRRRSRRSGRGRRPGSG
jgi:hypothetical protein